MNVPTGYTALDMVGFTDKGTYNSATAYVKNDIAHYGGNLWRCLVDDTTGVTPTEGVNWTVFLAEPTSAAEDIIAQVETTSTAAHSYAVGKQLIYNDTLYTVTSAITVGDMLTVGTNITASDSIVDQLDTKANSSDLATVATTGAYSDLSGKPTLGTAAEKNVPASGDASSSEVVMGDDSRLTNARNAADVSAWAKAANKPTYNGAEILTSTAKTGTAQLSISDTVASGTSMDNVVGTMLDNDKTLDTNITSLNEALANEVTTRATLGAHNLFGVGNSLNEWFAATDDGKLPTNYLASDTITGTVNKDTNSVVITAYNNSGYRWGCKKINLKKNTRYTFSRTSCDGTIQLFGKNNADDRAVVISGLSNGGTVNSGDYDWWYVGFYPTLSGGYFSITDLLVRLETDADLTYQPYAKTNQQLTQETTGLLDNVNVMGAKNLLNNTATTQVLNGVTFTKSSDGRVTISGTATLTFSFHLNDEILLDAGTYTFSNGNVASPICFLRNAQESVNVCELTDGKEKSFSLGSSTTLQANVYIVNGTTYNTTIYPMIRLATDTDPTYQPYAMTNKELSEYSEGDFSSTYNTTYIKSSVHECKCVRFGPFKAVYLMTSILEKTIPGGTVLFTIGEKYRPKSAVFTTLHNTNGGNIVSVSIETDGKIKTLSSVTVPTEYSYCYIDTPLYL